MLEVDETFDDRLKETYQRDEPQAVARKICLRNHAEYFAEGVQSWFDNNRPPDHDHNHVDTRVERKEYDPDWQRLRGSLRYTNYYTKPVARLTGHLHDTIQTRLNLPLA